MALDALRREWIRKDLFIELWETRPQIKETKNQDETITKEVMLDQYNKPLILTRLRGILRINTSEILFKPDLQQ